MTTTDVRVLAFTASQHRPLMLRHCILQMQQQSHAASHGIYLNSDNFDSDKDSTNYAALIADLSVKYPLNLAYGPSSHQHFNHSAAISQFDINHFDLFLKIDDDDIYLSDYIETVVADFKLHNWDFSGSASSGIVNGKNYDSKQQAYLNKVKLNDSYAHFMPGTFAFSRKAMRFLLDRGKTSDWATKYEDKVWLDWLIEATDITVHERKPHAYIYNVHGRNFSTHHLLKN